MLPSGLGGDAMDDGLLVGKENLATVDVAFESYLKLLRRF
jgi:hypothetical protein